MTENATPLRVLVADDEESMRHFLKRGLERLGYEVVAVEHGAAAVQAWRSSAFDAAVLDLMMPQLQGSEVLAQLRAATPDAVVVMMTAHGTIQNAVAAMRLGAEDFLTKPFSLEELQLRLTRALSGRAQQHELQQLRSVLAPTGLGVGLVAESRAMAELTAQIEALRSSDSTVLLTGESGVGKGLIAQALHRTSARAQGPFVTLNCAALAENLVESELFGHEAGAFTGALRSKPGLLARAHRGTLFLDEIGDMSRAAQAKIERFLQEREFTPLGSQQVQKADVRVLAATNRDLAALTASGAFRSELRFRLDVVKLQVPALRDRREDIAVLLQRSLERCGRPAMRLSADALAALTIYDWPGNVRELENAIERMVALAGQRNELTLADLPAEIRHRGDELGPDRNDYETARRKFDHAYFASLLAQCEGSVTDAARRAGLSRGHLHRRLKELAEPPGSPETEPGG